MLYNRVIITTHNDGIINEYFVIDRYWDNQLVHSRAFNMKHYAQTCRILTKQYDDMNLLTTTNKYEHAVLYFNSGWKDYHAGLRK